MSNRHPIDYVGIYSHFPSAIFDYKFDENTVHFVQLKIAELDSFFKKCLNKNPPSLSVMKVLSQKLLVKPLNRQPARFPWGAPGPLKCVEKIIEIVEFKV